MILATRPENCSSDKNSSLDARSGYHQIAVRCCDQDKLAFFSPDNEKHTFGVMPFGPRNAPGFCTCFMHVLSTE